MAFNDPTVQAGMNALQDWTSGRQSLSGTQERLARLDAYGEAGMDRPALEVDVEAWKRKRSGGGGGGGAPESQPARIGWKTNIEDFRQSAAWQLMPPWQREEIMAAQAKENARIEAQEQKRHQQEEAERLAGLAGAKRDAEQAKFAKYAKEGLFPFADFAGPARSIEGR